MAKVGGALCSQVCLDLLGNVNLGITVTMPPPLPHPPQSQEEGTNAPLAHIVHWAAQHPLFVHLASTVLWRRQRHLKATARLDSTAQAVPQLPHQLMELQGTSVPKARTVPLVVSTLPSVPLAHSLTPSRIQTYRPVLTVLKASTVKVMAFFKHLEIALQGSIVHLDKRSRTPMAWNAPRGTSVQEGTQYLCAASPVRTKMRSSRQLAR